MAKDYFALLNEHEDRRRRERHRQRAAELSRQAAHKAYVKAWNDVLNALSTADNIPDHVPDMQTFIVLAKALKARGWYAWFHEMAENIANSLEDPTQYRPAQLFFAQLIILAGKPRATAKRLLVEYRRFAPSIPIAGWRHGGANDVFDFLGVRIQQAQNEKQLAAQKERDEAAANRITYLRKAAAGRPAHEKQVFAVHWNDNGLTPAAIRDKWNRLHPLDKLDAGRTGRQDIKAAITRGRQFLAKHSATALEFASALSLRLDT